MESGKVTTEYNGRSYTGTYRVEREIITVRCARERKSTYVGNLEYEGLARMLLREIITRPERAESLHRAAASD